MNRRRFLGLFGAGVAGIALKQAIPLGRVWSFPKEIVIAKSSVVTLNQVSGIDLEWRYSEVFGATLDDYTTAAESFYSAWHRLTPERFLNNHCGLPPGRFPVAQLKSCLVPGLLPARGIPES